MTYLCPAGPGTRRHFSRVNKKKDALQLDGVTLENWLALLGNRKLKIERRGVSLERLTDSDNKEL